MWAVALCGACILHPRSRGQPQLPAQYSRPRAHKTWARVAAELRHSLAGLAARLLLAGNFGGWGIPRMRNGSRTASPASSRRGSLDGRRGGACFCASVGVVQARWKALCRQVGLEPSSSVAWWASWLALLLAAAALAACLAAGVVAWYFLSIWWDSPTSAAAMAVGGQFSQFTIVTMTYHARLPTLRLFVQHYSKCPSGQHTSLLIAGSARVWEGTMACTLPLAPYCGRGAIVTCLLLDVCRSWHVLGCATCKGA